MPLYRNIMLHASTAVSCSIPLFYTTAWCRILSRRNTPIKPFMMLIHYQGYEWFALLLTGSQIYQLAHKRIYIYVSNLLAFHDLNWPPAFSRSTLSNNKNISRTLTVQMCRIILRLSIIIDVNSLKTDYLEGCGGWGSS